MKIKINNFAGLKERSPIYNKYSPNLLSGLGCTNFTFANSKLETPKEHFVLEILTNLIQELTWW